MTPQAQLAVFAMLGLVLCFVNLPAAGSLAGNRVLRGVDGALALLSVACCLYVIVQTESTFKSFWIGGRMLGNRAGQEAGLDIVVGAIGLLLVLEATRRSIGLALPLLGVVFVVYAFIGPFLPGWLFPHRGYDVERVVAQTFLHTEGVFGTALRVMFTYVYLFVVLGAFLKASGATQFIIDFAQRLFGNTPGGPAKVSVVSSGLMGSLSGSAVANTATTGTFTIPMMKASGFRPAIAGGIEAAASSGGALVPPVMGAGAYMMLEIVEPPVTYLQIVQAAILPAIVYYLSLLLIVHLYAQRIGADRPADMPERPRGRILEFEGVVFLAGVVGLVALLIAGYSVFRAVSLAILAVIVISLVTPRTRITLRKGLDALRESARDVVPLVAASACVGIIMGVVTLTGIGTKLPAAILALSQGSLLAALVLIMVSSIILGMGLPSAVCYLLMATLVGPVLAHLGVVPLSAHLFIFYFGMMSMVTPPVALAGYTAASIAGAGIMETSFAAFRFALVGFTLPFLFVFRPELLMLARDGSGTASFLGIAGALLLAVLGVIPFAAAIAGQLYTRLSTGRRATLYAASALLLLPMPLVPRIPWTQGPITALPGIAILAWVVITDRRAARRGSR